MWFRPGELSDHSLRDGDVVIVEGGAGYGRSSVLRGDRLGWGFQNSIIRVRPRARRSDGRYLDYALQSALADGSIALVANTATIPHFTAEKVSQFQVPLPRYKVQCAIADYLDREMAKIDLLIEKQEALVKRLAERRSAVIHRLVTKGVREEPLVDAGAQWVGQVPSSWKVGNIRSFASMRTGHTPSRSRSEYWQNTTIPWFTLADVWQLRSGTQKYLGKTNQQISELGLASSSAELLPAGTVVLSRTASVGFAGVMPQPMATSQDFWNWICGPEVLPEYLLGVFWAMSSEFEALRYGSTHNTIYKSDAAGLRIPVPPLGEQRVIVGQLDSETARIDTLIGKTERFIELAKERRAALITAAVTGQIDVTAKEAA